MAPPSTLLLATTVFLVFPVAHGATKSAYYTLLTNLLANYKREVRPVNDDSYPSEVYLTFQLLSVQDVNEQDQTLITNAQLQVEWYSEFLEWDADLHENITSILLPQKSLWLPDIVLGNTVTSQKQLGYDNLQLRLDDDGYTVWTPSGVFETSCDIDITYYPFDTQVCSIVFQTAVSLQKEIYIYIDKENPIDTSEYSANGLWDLLNASAQNSDAEDSRTKIEFKIQLQRRRTFYVLNIILPVLFLAFTSSLTFALPADAGEKMSLSITILLAYAVYLTLITGAMPSTSVQVSVLTVYLVILLAVTAASVILSVWVLSYHHRPENRPVTGRLAKITIALRKILCMHADDAESNVVTNDDAVMEVITSQYNGMPHGKPKPNSVSPATASGEAQISGGLKSRDTKTTKQSRFPVVSGGVVAETFDKFIFILLLIISLTATVACLMAIGIGATQQLESTRLTSN